MSAHTQPRINDASPLYARMEERMLARDQVGASQAFYELAKAGRPLGEMVAEAVRIHAPYTHVPYHERIDDGYVNFVNNDHCLLSARATINLTKLVPDALALLPMAQTVWYIPTGLDVWNQKIGRAPGHYTRGFDGSIENPPAPAVYWPDSPPLRAEGPLRDRLGNWLTQVHRGNVMEAYRHFLGLMEAPAERREVLAELVFAGMIDVQDRMYLNRSYTTGHKGYRARATVELGEALGWENAHQVVYAGALDLAVGPRWYSVYEMACNIVKTEIEGQTLRAIPYGGVSDAEAAMLRNAAPLSAEEEAGLIRTLLHGVGEPENTGAVTALLRAGKDPRRIIDAMQIAAAELTITTHDPNNFSMPMHTYEYCNALGWFFDNFAHPRRLRLLYVAAEFISMTAHHQRHTGEMIARPVAVPAGAAKLGQAALLARIDDATCAQRAEEAQGWVQAYLDTIADRAPLVQALAIASCKIGNDPHNQEIPQNMLEDFQKSRSPQRDRLLLACTQHCAGHRKYGDIMEAARRFSEGVGVALQ